MKQQKINLTALALCLLISLFFIGTSCSPKYANGCQGNKKMLSAGAGYTKFRR